MATYTPSQLAEASGVPDRSIRRYVYEGILAFTPYRGKKTTYDEIHLWGLYAMNRLRAEGVYRLDEFKARLSGRSLDELVAIARGTPSSPVGKGATVIASPAPSAVAMEAPAATVNAPPPPAEPRVRRIPLLPGMELVVREDATDLVKRLAAEIHASYGTSVLTPPASLGE